jgi:hypothetical protein
MLKPTHDDYTCFWSGCSLELKIQILSGESLDALVQLTQPSMKGTTVLGMPGHPNAQD